MHKDKTSAKCTQPGMAKGGANKVIDEHGEMERGGKVRTQIL